MTFNIRAAIFIFLFCILMVVNELAPIPVYQHIMISVGQLSIIILFISDIPEETFKPKNNAAAN